VEAALALVSSVQVVPPFTEMYGTIAVGVQVVVLVTVSAMLVAAVTLPEVPEMVTVEVPAAAELLAVRVSTLLPVVGLVAKPAVTPLGRPDAARVMLPVNPPVSATVMVSVPLAFWATERLAAERESVKLGVVPPLAVIVNACVLLQLLALV
jgi:hypothetical protein